jgi:anaerobic selenocysteine-containing dehydrogenase
MSTSKFAPTACNLCYANCGILVQVDDGHIVKVRGDRDHPASRGYLCNKASRLDYYQHGRDRISSPLRRRPDGTFEAIDWETAIAEVAARFRRIRDTFGGDKIMYYGGGGQGNHLGPFHVSSTQRALGIRLRSSALAQEKTGLAWTSERVLGGFWHGDFEGCDVALMMGKNAWQTNGFQRARSVIQAIAKDPDRTLIVFDPRRTETAELADIHLAVNPGTDAWCITAILGYLVQHGLVNDDWLRAHANGYEQVIAFLRDVPVDTYARFSGIDPSQVAEVARVLGSTDRIGVYEDVGIEMAPNSTLCSYLNILLFALRGSFANEGGMHLVNPLLSIFGFGAGSGTVDAQGFETGYRTSPVTGARIVCGLLPCNSIAEEILTDHPARIRGMLVESGNPAHSVADSRRFREACDTLDTLVVIDVAMTETARLADYVLPASSQYEKVEATFFNFEYPGNFFHLRHPLFEPMPGTLPEAEIHARLVEALDVFAPGELDALNVAADSGLERYAETFFAAMKDDSRIGAYATYVLYRTLGPSLPAGMASAAPLWLLCQHYARGHADDVRRAGHAGEGYTLGNALFEAILSNRSGTVIAMADIRTDRRQWRKASGKLELGMGEMLQEWETLQDFSLPPRSDEFPLLLVAGERRQYTANTAIRDPAWMKSNSPAALAIHPADARACAVPDAATARLVTRRGSVDVQVQYDDCMKPGTVSLPNGLGLSYPDASGRTAMFGVPPNELTDIDDRDPWVGTPWHKHVRARLDSIANPEKRGVI